MTMLTSSAKAKGRRLQQKVCALLLKAFPQLEKDDIKSTSMGASGEDVQLSPAARKLLPYSIECKKHKSFAIYKHYDQAKTNASKHTPLLVIEGDRREPLVVLSLQNFIKLLKDKR